MGEKYETKQAELAEILTPNLSPPPAPALGHGATHDAVTSPLANAFSSIAHGHSSCHDLIARIKAHGFDQCLNSFQFFRELADIGNLVFRLKWRGVNI